LKRRSETYPTEPWSAFFEWNLAYLRFQACQPTREDILGSLRDFYFFDPIDGDGHPTFRHLRRVSPPGWFVTNSFGWRGPDLALNKPPNTIRIAFVGASTTVDAYSAPVSHPELVGYWLNRWAESQLLPYRFEVINAGRTGINSNSIAAIVQKELVPVEPDLVVFYEGANQFWPGQMVAAPGAPAFEKPKSTFHERTRVEAYSALVKRVLRAIDLAHAPRDGREPPKPPSTIAWPPGVDEFAPAIDDPRLPMDLPAVVRDLDSMRTSLQAIGSELVMASFVWIVQDGMVLNIGRDLNLYEYLNRNYWPVTYAEMRRIADFQNRVFAAYARAHALPFIDFAAEYPQDPALAVDAIHFRYPGIVLEAWMLLQRLIPLVDERIADGRLPRPQRVMRDVHPAFDQPSPRMMRFDTLGAGCN
jgi:hypothetical protein